jgi:hypothetical protein
MSILRLLDFVSVRPMAEAAPKGGAEHIAAHT